MFNSNDAYLLPDYDNNNGFIVTTTENHFSEDQNEFLHNIILIIANFRSRVIACLNPDGLDEAQDATKRRMECQVITASSSDK